ncbi:MAG: hypothetical protein JRG91_00020 [Deltaproteobacteria bacterium]|nr:hypothetical protein [Deltaproteobacteria bacterium]
MHARIALAAAACLVAGCRSCQPPPGPGDAVDDRRLSIPGDETAGFLEHRRPQYAAARVKARKWLDDLEVDPSLLRSHGIKGKKKLVELLDAYVWLMRDPLGEDTRALMARAEEVIQPTREAAYHDMAAVDDRQFKQDATSYMRAAYLMDRLGMDTGQYVEQMRKVLPRFDEHMPTRGPAQQMIFHTYYSHFGFPEPFPLDRAFEKGRIAARADPHTLERMPIYHLTHEIFMPFRYGEVRETDFFDEDDEAYLTGALPVLVKRRIAARDPDLVAELVLCLEYLDMEDDPTYAEGIAFLLDSQNADGSWGDYPEADRRHGPYARHHIYLHTTKLALSALINAFRCPG